MCVAINKGQIIQVYIFQKTHVFSEYVQKMEMSYIGRILEYDITITRVIWIEHIHYPKY